MYNTREVQRSKEIRRGKTEQIELLPSCMKTLHKRKKMEKRHPVKLAMDFTCRGEKQIKHMAVEKLSYYDL